MESQNLYSDVVVLGGGFSGVNAARSLARRLKKLKLTDKTVSVVSDDNHLVFQPMLPEVAGSAVSPRHVVNPIRTMCRDARVLKAEVTDIDPDKKRLTLSAGDYGGTLELGFDQLILCAGSLTNLSLIPGAQEHAFPMQNVGDAMRIRAKVISRFEEALLTDDESARRKLLSFVFIGGGYSGVETAGQVLDMCKAMCRFYKGVEFEDCSFTLVHGGEALMPTAHRKLGDYTKDRLEERGLRVLLKTRVTSVTANRIHLNTNERIETNTVVCSIGNKAHPVVSLIAEKAGAKRERDRVVVGSDGCSEEVPWLWSAGDCCYFPHPDGGECPASAQFATRQGKLVGDNVARKIADRKTKPFDFRGFGELAAIGHHSAVADIKGLRFSGFFAWWMWRTIYLSKLPGLDRKLRVLVDWTLDLFFPRDITLLSPRFSTDVSDTYLSDGDTLYNKGDPAFSFYIVRSGTVELRDGDHVVRTIRKGQHFGELALLGSRRFHYDAVARGAATLTRVNRNIFERVLLSDDAFAEDLQRSAASFVTGNCDIQSVKDRLPSDLLETHVDEVMREQVTVLSTSQTVDAALEAIGDADDTDVFPVVDRHEQIRGLVDKRTLKLQACRPDDSEEVSLSDLQMDTKIATVGPRGSVEDAVDSMADKGCCEAIVIDENKKGIQGVISIHDAFEKAEVYAANR